MLAPAADQPGDRALDLGHLLRRVARSGELYDVLAVEHEERGKARADAREEASTGIIDEANRRARKALREKLFGGGAVLVGIDAEDNEAGLAVATRQPIERAERRPAGGAPARPEIENHDLSPKVAEPDGRSGAVDEVEAIESIADVERAGSRGRYGERGEDDPRRARRSHQCRREAPHQKRQERPPRMR